MIYGDILVMILLLLLLLVFLFWDVDHWQGDYENLLKLMLSGMKWNERYDGVFDENESEESMPQYKIPSSH
jgi:hypothetical protein